MITLLHALARPQGYSRERGGWKQDVSRHVLLLRDLQRGTSNNMSCTPASSLPPLAHSNREVTIPLVTGQTLKRVCSPCLTLSALGDFVSSRRGLNVYSLQSLWCCNVCTSLSDRMIFAPQAHARASLFGGKFRTNGVESATDRLPTSVPTTTLPTNSFCTTAAAASWRVRSISLPGRLRPFGPQQPKAEGSRPRNSGARRVGDLREGTAGMGELCAAKWPLVSERSGLALESYRDTRAICLWVCC